MSMMLQKTRMLLTSISSNSNKRMNHLIYFNRDHTVWSHHKTSNWRKDNKKVDDCCSLSREKIEGYYKKFILTRSQRFSNTSKR